MNRPLALTVPFALAACFSLTGCTIYTYSSDPNTARKPGKTKPAATATTKPGVVRRPTGTTSGGTRGGGGSTPATETPTVQSKTIFGGASILPFAGEAFVIPDGTSKMPNFDDLVPFAKLYTDQFMIAPQTFSGGFPGALLQDEWFGIRYTGKILIPTDDKWTFKLASDDGAILYIDDKKIIDNDGVHTARTTTGEADLKSGRHTLRLEYFQEKKGSVALQLFMVVAGRDVAVTGIP